MADEKKLVIKINYPNRAAKLPETETHPEEYLTEWNIKRIAGAVALICLLTAGGYFWLTRKSGSDINESTAVSPAQVTVIDTPLLQSNSANEAEETISQDGAKKIIALPMSSESKKETPLISKEDNIAKQLLTEQTANRDASSAAVSPSGEVVRGVLASAVVGKEPKGNIQLPLVLNKNGEKVLYYFTELKNMSGKTVYHEWFYKEKSVFKRPIKMTESHWRTATHKIIRSTAPGDWSVRVTDQNGAIMHRIDFKVVIAN